MAPLGNGTRRRRCVVLDDGTTVSCYVRNTHETHAVVVEPSGHAYSYIPPGGALTRHLTPTALSAHRELVRDAVALRNRFAWHTAAPHVQPYVHLSLEDGSAVRYQRRLRSTRARWPGSGAFRVDALFNAREQCFELQSVEGLARVRLHASGLLVDLLFLAEARATAVATTDADADAQASAFAHYATVRQTVAVACVPEQFALPVAILLRAKAVHDAGEQQTFDFELEEGRHRVVSALPESSAFAARPEFCAIAPPARAVLASASASASPDLGIPLPEILRVATMPSRQLYGRVAVEVAEDESVFFIPSRSRPEILVYSLRDRSVLACRGEFFKWIHASGRLLQQFTMETIPPAVSLSREGSSAALLAWCQHTQYLFQAFRRADRGEAVLSADSLEPQDSEASAAIVEEVENEHGRFRALRDGTVRVAFADRTILKVQRGGGACVFFFPDGSAGESSLAAAPPRQRAYIQRALEFADWAFATLDERMARFQQRQRAQEVAQQELKRLRVRFELNTGSGRAELGSHCGPVGAEASHADASALSPEELSQVQSDTRRHIAAVDRALQAARAVAFGSLH